MTFAAELVNGVLSGPSSLVDSCSDLDDGSLVTIEDDSSLMCVDDAEEDPVILEERVGAWTSVDGRNDVWVADLVALPELVGDSVRSF